MRGSGAGGFVYTGIRAGAIFPLRAMAVPPPGAELGKALLLSVVFVPVLLGMWAASARRARGGLLRIVAAVLAFDGLYALLVYYLYLRIV